MRSKGQHTTKTKNALGVYIDQGTIALCVVRDSTEGLDLGRHIRLLTPIDRTTQSSADRLVQAVMTRCAEELGDGIFAFGCCMAIGQAQCLAAPLADVLHPEALLHLDVARELSAYVANHVAEHMDQGASFEEAKSLSQGSWLDDARPKDPPIFDYVLRKRQHETDEVEAWLWWASGESEVELREAMGRTGIPIEGLIPDGIALYRGLLHYWQENGVSPDCLQGEWVLIDVSTQTSAWFFCDCWFQARKQYGNDDIVRDREIHRRHTVVIWGCANNPEPLPFETECVLDHLLRPPGVGGLTSPAKETVSSLIALGLALQGVEPRVNEWHTAGDSPTINLLPWRGQRLQRLRSQLCAHIGIAASLFTLTALLWAGLLNGVLQRDRVHLATLAQRLEQREQSERQAEQQQKNRRQDERTRDHLVSLAGTGERQLDYLRRVLELIPECVSLTKVVLGGTSISVSGIAGDPAQLRVLPANLFAAFAEDGKNILNAWPLLRADTSASGQSGQHDEQERFVLRVSFDKTLKPASSEVVQRPNAEGFNNESGNKESFNKDRLNKDRLNKDRLNKENSKRDSSSKETLAKELWNDR